MSTTVGSVGVTLSTKNYSSAVATTAPVLPTASNASHSTNSSKPNPLKVDASKTPAHESVKSQSVSEKLILSPAVGIITEYVDNQGNVEGQDPSAAAVAYLQATQKTQATTSTKTIA